MEELNKIINESIIQSSVWEKGKYIDKYLFSKEELLLLLSLVAEKQRINCKKVFTDIFFDDEVARDILNAPSPVDDIKL